MKKILVALDASPAARSVVGSALALAELLGAEVEALHVELDGRRKTLNRGDTLLVLPGVWHRFWTDTGCVFEELSTTHFANDSVYRDEAINSLTPAQRKTVVDHWGRFQLGDQLRDAQVPAP